MKNALLLVCVFVTTVAQAQSGDEMQIRKLLATQTKEWNRGNLEGFMQTYWQSDSLLFIGKSGVQRGWQRTLANYQKSYPDTAAMGQLSFAILEMKQLSPVYYYVVGKWMLNRSVGNLSGHFDLLLQKLNGRWVIVADHSS